CGGMLEAGIGRAHNIAISSLANFSLPGDTAASSKYWYKDIIQPEVTVEQGMLKVPDTPGIGYTVNRQADRKSTRLNSSHVSISYAVFCLKKKTLTERQLW